jgi:outer membrane protein assembly factor BamB
MPLRRWFVGGLCILAALGLCACGAGKSGKQAAGVPQLDLQARPVHAGGDQQAWLSPAGGNADSGFCQAKLVLPLAAKPAWSKYYSRAEFSAYAPQEIVHYAGSVCVTALSPQLLVLDARTGMQLDNEVRFEGQYESGTLMRLFGLTLHPAGLLIARDDFARLYCFDLQGGKLQRRWLLDRFVAPDDQVCITQNDKVLFGGQGRIIAGTIDDGSQLWSYPVLLPGNGKIASQDGVLVWWSARGMCGALEIDSGKLLWNVALSTQISRIIIDEAHKCIYLTREDERVECRDLRSGEMRWEYTWSWVLAPDDRARLARRLQAEAQVPAAGIVVRCGQLNCIPAGVALCLGSGDVLALNPQGRLLWHAKTGKPLISGVAFENGLLIVEGYARIGGQAQLPNFFPFMLDAPDWPGYLAASEQRRQNRLFSRFSVLDVNSGHVLDVFEPPLSVTTALIPAYNMVIFGMGRDQDVQCSVQAYPWLEPRGL